MKRSGFRRAPPPAHVRQPLKLNNITSPSIMRRADAGSAPVQKDSPVRNEAYRRLVAALPCAHCGRAGPSQAAHADEGKGLSIKADDRTCFPLCADSPGRQGCHSLFGASGKLSREHRRALESKHSAATWAALDAAGLIPAGLEPLNSHCAVTQ